MIRRLSNVGAIKVTAFTFSSVFEIGDSNHITPVMKGLAVKREYPLFFSNEGNFEQYSIFSRPIPKVPIEDTIDMMTFNAKPTINVESIVITGVSSSSVVQIGSNNLIHSDARIKHIRQLLQQTEENEEDS